jgi:hypothetical protein
MNALKKLANIPGWLRPRLLVILFLLAIGFISQLTSDLPDVHVALHTSAATR